MNFSDTLILQAQPHWQHATDNFFIQEMVDGTLDKRAFTYYLIQDYAFIHAFLNLLSHTIAYSKTIEQKHQLSTFLSMVTSKENNYFIRSFKALEVKESIYLSPEYSTSIDGFKSEIQDAISSSTLPYEHCLVVLGCAESVYLEWGMKYRKKTPEAFYFNEWITLHNNSFFQSFVSWLKQELDTLGTYTEIQQTEFKKRFTRTCKLEADFFTECYQKA